MESWAVLAARGATLTSGISLTVIPVLGAGSLDWFALGVLLAGAYFGTLNATWHGLGAGRAGRAGWAGRGGTARPSVRDLLARAWPRRGRRPEGNTFPRSAADQAHDLAARPFLAAPTALPQWGEPIKPDLPAESAQTGPFWPIGLFDPEQSVLPDISSRAVRSPRFRRSRNEPGAIAAPSSITPSSITPSAEHPAGRGRPGIRHRIDAMLTEMLGDESDGTQAPPPTEPDESFWGPAERSEESSAGYRSKHRFTDPAKEPKRQAGSRRVPRHAAPPASFSARLPGRYAAS
jgi:hypothetical protein